MSRHTLRTTPLLALLVLLGACSNTPPSQLATTAESSDEVPDEVAMADSDDIDPGEAGDEPAQADESGATGDTGFTLDLDDVPSADASDDPVPGDGASSGDDVPGDDASGNDVSDDDASVEDASGEPPVADVDGIETADGTLPRTTAEGIGLTSATTEFDFGDGDEPSLEIDAQHPNGSVGIYIPTDQLIADTEVLDVLRWAGSSGTFIVLAETGPTVATVRMTSTLGGIDQTLPVSNFAVLAVRADELAQFTVTGLDANGNTVAECAAQSLLLMCSTV